MDKLTYKELIDFENNAFKEQYYYRHKFHRDEEDHKVLDYYDAVLEKINWIKENALKEYLENNYLTINDIRFVDEG